ncbi:hypothetical protein ACLOJK_023044 [Asimina triloba]
MSKQLSELDDVRVKRDEAVGSVVAAREKAFQFSTNLVALRSETEALRARGADPNINGEIFRAELEAIRGEVSDPNKKILKILRRLKLKKTLHEVVQDQKKNDSTHATKPIGTNIPEFEAARVEVAQLRMELETSRADLECLQEASS